MRFILPSGFLIRFNTLRIQYEKEKHIDFTAKVPMLGVPTFFGGTNIKARNAQINFLEKLIAILQPDFNSKDPEKVLSARQTFIATCLYLQKKIGSSERNSVLYRLIDENLGVTTENYLDTEDKDLCNLAANRLLSSPNFTLQKANKALKAAGLDPLAEKDWSDFSKHINSACCEVKTEKKSSQYPVAAITRPVCASVFSYTGATIGVLGGELISNSTNAFATKYQLTAMIGTTLLVLGPAGPASIALFAPVIASRLLSTFCTISAGHILGSAFRLLGDGIGASIALPFDLSYLLLCKLFAVIGNYFAKEEKINNTTGMRIADGKNMVCGFEIDVTAIEDLPQDYAKNTIEVKDETLWINGKLVSTPEKEAQLVQNDTKTNAANENNIEGIVNTDAVVSLN